MAQTPLQHCRCGCGWLVISGKQNLGKEAGVLASCPEEWPSCVSGRAVEALSDNISNSCLMKECEELEESCGVSLTRDILGGQAVWGRGSQEKLRCHDQKQLLESVKPRPPLWQ